MDIVHNVPLGGVKFGGNCEGLVEPSGRIATAAAFGELTLRVADPQTFSTTLGAKTTEDLMSYLLPQLLELLTACANEWLRAGYYTLDTIAKAGVELAQTITPHGQSAFRQYGLELMSIDQLMLRIR